MPDKVWGEDTSERYARTLVSYFCSQASSFAIEEWVDHMVGLDLAERAVVWGSTSVVVLLVTTVVMSWVARHFGQPGTGSFLRKIGYVDDEQQG